MRNNYINQLRGEKKDFLKKMFQQKKLEFVEVFVFSGRKKFEQLIQLSEKKIKFSDD